MYTFSTLTLGLTLLGRSPTLPVFELFYPEAAFFLAPLKPGYFGRLRHELDSPNLRGHLPHHPCCNPPLRRTEMGCGGEDNWNPYSAYLLSDLRNPPPL
ncbi:hypothetical protein AVEN_117876-1 [Araneus ventricosus]|uniref:Uncharacterized protein n=1 Tax=Araneus ventricosus TaxID=182803 RepID=A0A4Y2VY33_ARAVE|nr:hypothetical protein AVEN_117876-1 [Araneus ventricosus]